jgi:hypothetical protein
MNCELFKKASRLARIEGLEELPEICPNGWDCNVNNIRCALLAVSDEDAGVVVMVEDVGQNFWVNHLEGRQQRQQQVNKFYRRLEITAEMREIGINE